MRQNPHVRIYGGPGSATTLVYPTVIRRRGPWRTIEDVEFATLTRVDWFNTRRLLEPIGYVPPAEFDAAYHQQAEAMTVN